MKSIPTAPSPFDPTADPFASTGPFAGPPETWEALASSDDRRERALALGQRHGELLQSLRDLGRENGGGLSGVGRGMLGRLEQHGLITAGDRERLTTLLEHLRAHVGQRDDRDAGLSRLQGLHQEIVDDETSSPLALAASSVALDSITQGLATDSPHGDAHLAGEADLVGFVAGSFAGPLTALAMGVTASTVAEHTHVTVSYD
jgi:hypothetical protein